MNSQTCVALGRREARLLKRPVDAVSWEIAEQTIDLAGLCGLVLDGWQEDDIRNGMGQRADGLWAAFEVADIVPRQNGKGSKLEARQLAGLVLLEEPLQIHTAHETKTMGEHLLRMIDLVDGAPQSIRRRFNKPKTGNGAESLSTKSGARLRFIARTKHSGRGFTGTTIYLDEAMEIGSGVIASLMPTMAAVPNPQIYYSGSAPYAEAGSNALRSVRRRALKDPDRNPRLALTEHSVSEDDKPDRLTVSHEQVLPLIAEANPALGSRISVEFALAEFDSAKSSDEEFDKWCRERLGIPDPDPGQGGSERVVPLAIWQSRTDHRSSIDGRLVLGLDVRPDRGAASVGAAGRRPDGAFHVELIEHRAGTGWVARRVADLFERHDVAGVVLDPAGPAGSLVAELIEAGVPEDLIEKQTAQGHAAACGLFYDLASGRDVRGLYHLAQPDLDDALHDARKRKLGNAGSWLWDRGEDKVDITPLVAVTLALGSAVGLPAAEETFAPFVII
jgi:hypothetical protein